MKRDLARVLDPAALAAAGGARARLRVEVPSAWLLAGAELEITLPARIGCARCDGGGCDGCGRSGALRAPDDPAERAIRVHLPAGDGRAVALRIVRPFGVATDVDQLVLEIGPASECDARVRRIERKPEAEGSEGSIAWSPAAMAATAIVVLGMLAALLMGGR